MNRDLQALLEARREERIERAARRLLDGAEAQDLRPEIEQIDAYSKLLTAAGPKREINWVWPAAVASVCVAVAGILWSLKIPSTDVAVTVETDSVSAVLQKPWRIDNAFHSSLIHFERLSTVHAPNLGLAIDQESCDAWLELNGGRIDLQTLEIDKDAAVEIETDHQEVDIYTRRAPLTGRLTITGKVTVSAGPRAGETSVSGSHEIEIPETVEFGVGTPQSVPSHLTVHSLDPWTLGHPQAARLGFIREEMRGAGERSLVSGVKSGTVRLDDTSRAALELREGDVLGMRPAESAVLDVRGAPSGVIHVNVNGAVSGIRVGRSTAGRELTPSYLEYLYNRKSLAFFWGAVVFLWGLIWSIRNTILR